MVIMISHSVEVPHNGHCRLLQHSKYSERDAFQLGMFRHIPMIFSFTKTEEGDGGDKHTQTHTEDSRPDRYMQLI